MEGFEVQSAIMLGGEKGVPWVKGQKVPDTENTHIDKIVVNGDLVECFFQMSEPGKTATGGHIRFPPPRCIFTVETAPRAAWEETKSDDDGRDFRMLGDPYGNHWVLDQPIPNGGASIVRIASDEYGVTRVYALPDAHSRWSKTNHGLLFTFFPNTGCLLFSEGLPLSRWSEIQAEVEEEANGPDLVECPKCGAPNEDDADFCAACGAEMDGDEEEVPPSGAQPSAQPAPAVAPVAALPLPPPPPPAPEPASSFMPPDPVVETTEPGATAQ